MVNYIDREFSYNEEDYCFDGVLIHDSEGFITYEGKFYLMNEEGEWNEVDDPVESSDDLVTYLRLSWDILGNLVR